MVSTSYYFALYFTSCFAQYLKINLAFFVTLHIFATNVVLIFTFSYYPNNYSTFCVFFISSDAKNMAKHVNETLLQLLSERTGQGAYESTLILAKLREEKRYREDIWT